MIAGALLSQFGFAQAPAELPVVKVTRDNTAIDHSCRVVIEPGALIADPDNNGVIQIKGRGITVEFEPGSVLQGGPTTTDPDQFTGVGITVTDSPGVTLRNLRVNGFKVGLLAQNCDSLTLDNAGFADNYRQRLRSTPSAEDGQDWLFPHENDKHEWRTQHGAAVCIERSSGVTVKNVTVRRGQNGIILDRVNDSRIYDNDCSFLSGWGIAMWRSCGNIISRNAVDFCVRGHSEGVYNRGQDSAGFLFFEQCHRNAFLENSATHGGDCFFGFAGKEAIGERPPADGTPVAPENAGCNDNLLMENDFSYAPAHGIEMTFSRRNRFIHNRIVGNAICGVWGGYSNDTTIAENNFSDNGGMAYGLECGGVNIEHGSGNRIIANSFINNRCAVHLWWDDDGNLLKLPGVAGMHRGVVGNIIAQNHFEINPNHPFTSPRERNSPLVVIRLRDTGDGHVKDNLYTVNALQLTDPRATEFDVKPGIEPTTTGKFDAVYQEENHAVGEKHPVGARPQLRGRDQIIMGPWGPWDHESPMVRTRSREGGKHVYEVFGNMPEGLGLTCSVTAEAVAPTAPGRPTVVTVTPKGGADVQPYRLSLKAKDLNFTAKDVLIAASWEVVAFPWSKDPRTDFEGYTADRKRVPKAAVTLPSLDLNFGGRGPRDMPQFAEVRDKAPGPDHFGIVAVSTMNLPKGVWKITTLTDDGIRVKATTKAGTTTVIENWTWHGPTRDQGIFKVEEDQPVTLAVEYFEIDGHAVLQLNIEPDSARPNP
ncbi:MAG: right-handed parallel beta-helix repeat-containing protein [Planctomycetes bacterium]|nr:right-handed parallel beta-helix repeat-containing protein [Planctomycetota bacterium]